MAQSVDGVADIPCFVCLVANRYKTSYHKCAPEHCKQLDKWLDSLKPKKDEKP